MGFVIGCHNVNSTLKIVSVFKATSSSVLVVVSLVIVIKENINSDNTRGDARITLSQRSDESLVPPSSLKRLVKERDKHIAAATATKKKPKDSYHSLSNRLLLLLRLT